MTILTLADEWKLDPTRKEKYPVFASRKLSFYGLNAYEFRIYTALVARACGDWVRATITDLSEEVGFGRSTVQKSIANLRRFGLIRAFSTKGIGDSLGNIYVITAQDEWIPKNKVAETRSNTIHQSESLEGLLQLIPKIVTALKNASKKFSAWLKSFSPDPQNPNQAQGDAMMPSDYGDASPQLGGSCREAENPAPSIYSKNIENKEEVWVVKPDLVRLEGSAKPGPHLPTPQEDPVESRNVAVQEQDLGKPRRLHTIFCVRHGHKHTRYTTAFNTFLGAAKSRGMFLTLEEIQANADFLAAMSLPEAIASLETFNRCKHRALYPTDPRSADLVAKQIGFSVSKAKTVDLPVEPELERVDLPSHDLPDPSLPLGEQIKKLRQMLKGKS